MASHVGIDAVLVMHGVYNGAESITHYDHAYDLADYQGLPYLYFTTVMDRRGGNSVPVAGFFMATRDDHFAEGFGTLMYAASVTIFGQEMVDAWNASVRPARLEKDDQPLTEHQMIRLMCDQYLKHAPGTRV